MDRLCGRHIFSYPTEFTGTYSHVNRSACTKGKPSFITRMFSYARDTHRSFWLLCIGHFILMWNLLLYAKVRTAFIQVNTRVKISQLLPLFFKDKCPYHSNTNIIHYRVFLFPVLERWSLLFIKLTDIMLLCFQPFWKRATNTISLKNCISPYYLFSTNASFSWEMLWSKPLPQEVPCEFGFFSTKSLGKFGHSNEESLREFFQRKWGPMPLLDPAFCTCSCEWYHNSQVNFSSGMQFDLQMFFLFNFAFTLSYVDLVNACVFIFIFIP